MLTAEETHHPPTFHSYNFLSRASRNNFHLKEIPPCPKTVCSPDRGGGEAVRSISDAISKSDRSLEEIHPLCVRGDRRKKEENSRGRFTEGDDVINGAFWDGER